MCYGFPLVTSEIKIRYKVPVPSGSVATVIGECRRLVDPKGRIELDGKIVAEAEVIMFYTGMLKKM